MTAFVRVSQRKVNNFEPPPIPGATGSPSNALRPRPQQAARRRRHLHPDADARCSKCRLGLSRTKAGKSPPASARPDMLEATASPGCRPIRASPAAYRRRASPAGRTWGRQNSNPQFQDPSVFNPRVNYSWHRRPPAASRPATSTRRINTEDRRLQPEVRPRQLRRPVQPPGRRRRPTRPPTTSPTSCSARAAPTAIINRSSPTCGSGCTSPTCRTTCKVNRKLTLNARAALRVRDAAVGEGQPPHQLRSGDQHAHPGARTDRSTIARCVNPDRNNFAPRLGLAYAIDDKTVVRAGYGISYIHFNRLGGENLLVVQRPARRRRQHQPAAVSQGLCAATTSADRPASGRPSRAIRRAYTTPANFNPLNVRVNYIPKDNPTGNVQSWHASVQREILPQPAGRRRLRRQQEPRTS